MAKSLEEILVKKKQQLAQAFRDMPAIAGEEIVNHALQNFENQGYNGDSFQAWQKRKIQLHGERKTILVERYL